MLNILCKCWKKNRNMSVICIRSKTLSILHQFAGKDLYKNCRKEKDRKVSVTIISAGPFISGRMHLLGLWIHGRTRRFDRRRQPAD